MRDAGVGSTAGVRFRPPAISAVLCEVAPARLWSAAATSDLSRPNSLAICCALRPGFSSRSCWIRSVWLITSGGLHSIISHAHTCGPALAEVLAWAGSAGRYCPRSSPRSTAVLAKVGVDRVDANLATAVRTSVVFVFAWLVALLARDPPPSRSAVRLGFTLCYPVSRRAFVGLLLSCDADGRSISGRARRQVERRVGDRLRRSVSGRAPDVDEGARRRPDRRGCDHAHAGVTPQSFRQRLRHLQQLRDRIPVPAGPSDLQRFLDRRPSRVSDAPCRSGNRCRPRAPRRANLFGSSLGSRELSPRFFARVGGQKHDQQLRGSTPGTDCARSPSRNSSVVPENHGGPKAEPLLDAHLRSAPPTGAGPRRHVAALHVGLHVAMPRDS